MKMHAGKCVTRAWALNFWQILNVSGADKAKEKDKNAVRYHWL
jgi:hypothetical protein